MEDNGEARLLHLEDQMFALPLDDILARLAALEQQGWQGAALGGGGGGDGGATTCIVRVTTQANAATAPAYTTGAGVLQVDPGSTPYADDSNGTTYAFKNDHNRAFLVGGFAKLVKISGDWWAVDVNDCAYFT